MPENTVDNQSLEKARELNKVEDFKEIDDQNGADGKQNPVKDAVGNWTDKQIQENPIAYFKYLKSKLKSATARQDLEEIKDLIVEISEINKKYFDNNNYIEQDRVR